MNDDDDKTNQQAAPVQEPDETPDPDSYYGEKDFDASDLDLSFLDEDGDDQGEDDDKAADSGKKAA